MKNIFPEDDGDINGIFTKKAVSYNVEGTNHGSYYLTTLFDQNYATHYCTQSYLYSSFSISFNKKINVKMYTVRTGSDWATVADYPKQWRVEAFNGRAWKNISTVTESGLTNISMKKTFFTNSDDYFKKIKFVSTGNNYRGSDRLMLCFADLDIFGIIRDSAITQCKIERNTAFVFIILVINHK